MSVRWVVHLPIGDASVSRLDRYAKVADEGLQLCGLFGRAIRLENQRRRTRRLKRRARIEKRLNSPSTRCNFRRGQPCLST